MPGYHAGIACRGVGQSLPCAVRDGRPPWVAAPGEMSEWLKEHAWKVCVPLKGTEGSNPSLSARSFAAPSAADTPSHPGRAPYGQLP